MSRSPAQELQLLLQSGWRLLAVETFEEKRALRALEAVAKASDRELVVWSLASGLARLKDRPSCSATLHFRVVSSIVRSA